MPVLFLSLRDSSVNSCDGPIEWHNVEYHHVMPRVPAVARKNALLVFRMARWKGFFGMFSRKIFRSHSFILLSIMSVVAGLSACTGGGETFEAQIEFFEATPLTVEPGFDVELSWSALDVDRCAIEPELGAVEAQDALIVNPVETTTYVLTCGNGTAEVTVTVVPPTSIDSFVADPPAFGVGEAVTLTWTTTTATSCTIEPGVGAVEPQGSVQVIPTETTVYTLACDGINTSASQTLEVVLGYPVEIGAFTVMPTHIIRGESAVLSWVSTESQTCAIDPDVGEVEVAGQVSVSPEEATTYTITCTGLIDSETAIVDLQVDAPAPRILSFGVVETAIAPGDQAEIFWTTENTTGCSIDQDIGSVDLNGNMLVSPAQTTAYQLTCSGEEGDDASSVVTVTVAPNVEIASFTATPAAIELGNMATLAWSTVNAETCEISPDIGPVDTTGVQQVQPVSTITYLLECVGPASSMTESLELLVVNPVEITTFSVSEETVELGDSITLTWAAQNADSCTIEPDIGTVDAVGVLTDVSPIETTNYILTCAGPVAEVSSENEVTVIPALTISEFSLDRAIIESGDSAVLSWTVTDADQCEIQPGVGVVELSGEATLSPEGTQTYTMECTNSIRTKTADVSLEVVEPLSLISFQASSNFFQTPSESITLQNGDNLYLSWESENATSCILNGGVGTVSPTDQLTTYPTESLTYELTCENAVKTESLQVEVTVVPKIVISSFLAQPYAIEPGAETTLSWDVVGASQCSLEGPGLESSGDGGTVTETDAGTTLMEVSLVGSTILTLNESSWYSISCTGPAGAETSSEQVLVVPPVEILFFDADPSVGINHEDDPASYPDSLNGATIEDNDYIRLTWDTRNASFGCQLNQNIGAVGESAVAIPEEVSPNEDTTYVLTCSNAAGSRTAELDVFVFPPIQIPVFSASPLTIDARETTTLTWSTVNASACELDNGLGEQPTSGSLALELLESTTFTLSCQGPVRVTERQVEIFVLPPNGPAEVTAIVTNPIEATASESIDVFWTLDGALETSLTFYPTEEDVVGLTQKSFVPFDEPSLFHSEVLIGLAMTNSESTTAYLDTPFGDTIGTGLNTQAVIGLEATAENDVVLALQFDNNLTIGSGTTNEESFNSTHLSSALVKLNPAGAFEWAIPMIGTAPVEMNDIDILSTGDIVFAGRFSGDMTIGEGPSQVSLSNGALTSFWGKATSLGEVVWADYATTETGGSTQIHQIDVDLEDNLALVGQMTKSATFKAGTADELRLENDAQDLDLFSDGFIVSFTADGQLNWARGIAMPGNSYVADVAAMADGTYILTGTFSNLAGQVDVGNAQIVESAGGNDILVMRLDAQGQTIWGKSIGASQADYGQYVAKGPNNTFFLAGQFDDVTNWGAGYLQYRLNAFGIADSGQKNGIIGQFDLNGDILWARGIGSISTDRILGLSVTPNGDAVITGVYSGTAFFQPANFWEDPNQPGFDAVYQVLNTPRPLNQGGALACTDCHVEGHGSGLNLNDIPDNVYTNLLAAGQNRVIVGTNWEESLVLRKPMLDGVSHGGGERVFVGDDFHQTVSAWLEQGAPRYAPKAEDPPLTEFTDYTLSGAGGVDVFIAAYGNGTGQLQWLTQAAGTGDEGPDDANAAPQNHLPGASVAVTPSGEVWSALTYENDLTIGTVEGGGETEIGQTANGKDVAVGYTVIPNRKFVRVQYREVSFTDDLVGALAESQCYECHSEGGASPNFAAPATDLHDELTNASAYVVPGDPTSSLLLNAPLSDANHSPDAGTPALIEGEPLEVLLNQWILEGAQFN